MNRQKLDTLTPEQYTGSWTPTNGGSCWKSDGEYLVKIIAAGRGQYASNQRPPNLPDETLAEIAAAAVGVFRSLRDDVLSHKRGSMAYLCAPLPHGARILNGSNILHKIIEIIV